MSWWVYVIFRLVIQQLQLELCNYPASVLLSVRNSQRIRWFSVFLGAKFWREKKNKKTIQIKIFFFFHYSLFHSSKNQFATKLLLFTQIIMPRAKKEPAAAPAEGEKKSKIPRKKPAEGVDKKAKHKKSNYSSYSTYIYKVRI